jgi:hypothetical protein
MQVYPLSPELYKRLSEYLDVSLEYLMFFERKNGKWIPPVAKPGMIGEGPPCGSLGAVSPDLVFFVTTFLPTVRSISCI